MTAAAFRPGWVALGVVVLAGCSTPRGPAPPSPQSASGPPPPAAEGPPVPAPPKAPPPSQAETGPSPEIVARFFTSPAEQRDELARNIVLPWLSLGLEAEAQASRERQGGDVTRERFIDSVTGGARIVPLDWLTAQTEVSYDVHDTKKTTVDEALVHLWGTKRVPWYLDVGKTDVPFGEYNSHFREDPLIQTVGEMQGWQVDGGYDTDALEATAGVFRGRTGNRPYGLVAKLSASPFKDFDVGAAWCSDIGESVELRRIMGEVRAENPGRVVRTRPVMGADAFATYETDRTFVDLEYVAALKPFARGILGDDRERPWSCDLDLAIRPVERWEFASRFEIAGGLPDEPRMQYGVGVSYGLNDHASLSLEFLHGVFRPGAPDRDLVEAGLILRW